MILKVTQLSRAGRPAGAHCGYSDHMPLFPFTVTEVAGINGAHPALVFMFSQKKARVCIRTDKLAVFQALRWQVTSVYLAVIAASGYVFCTVQQGLGYHSPNIFILFLQWWNT